MKTSQGVGIGIGIAILIFVIILGLNVYAVSNLQFRALSISDFSIFPDLNMNMNLEACNPTFFPASYKSIDLDVYYKQNNLGTASLYGSTIPPGTSVPTRGNIDLHSGSVLGSIIDAIGSALLGNEPTTDDVKFNVKLDAPIFGFIPFSIEKQYSYNEFSNLLEGEQNYDCSIQNPIPNFDQIESQFGSEINSLESALSDARKNLETNIASSQTELKQTQKEIESSLKTLQPDQEYTSSVNEGSKNTMKIPNSECGSFTSGYKQCTIEYEIFGGVVNDIVGDRPTNSLTIRINPIDEGSLTVTLPRQLIDAKIGNADDKFFVLVDGREYDYDEKSTSDSRTLTISFPSNVEEIEIIGTFISIN